MIVYNTLIAIAAGAGMVGFALFLQHLRRGNRLASEGWAALFAVTGTIMAVLGLATCIMWPYGGDGFEYANIAFGEPAAAFGVLCLFAAVYLWRNKKLFDGSSKVAAENVVRTLKPVSIFIFVSGLMMFALAVTWVRFQLGAAPEVEPITGRFADWPWLEAGVLGAMWGVVALGCLALPFALKNLRGSLMNLVITAFMIGGVAFSVFGAMNFYTHIGMFTNISQGTDYRW